MNKYREAFKNKKVLITGGLGFIGSNLALVMHQLGAQIEIIDALIPEHGGNYHNISPIRSDISIHIFRLENNWDALTKIISRQDYVFNLAGQSNHWDSMTNPQLDLDYNCNSHLALLETIRKVNPRIKLIFTSTRQIYGRPVYLPVDENHPIHPIDINGIHKAATEQYHFLYHKLYGLKVVALRLTNTFGPRMRVIDARQTFLGYWLRCAVENMKFEIWDGIQKRDFNFIDDVIDALIISAIDEKAIGKVYNLGNHEYCSLLDLAIIFSELFGAEYIIKEFPQDYKSIDIGDYYSNYTLINRDLNWSPRISLKEGLLKTFSFLKSNIEHYTEIYAFSKEYQNK